MHRGAGTALSARPSLQRFRNGRQLYRARADTIAQLVAEQWEKQNGRGISVNKQNLYRYLKNEGASEKYTSYVIRLSSAIADAMPIEIARKHDLKRD
jgi:hypothetical protein